MKQLQCTSNNTLFDILSQIDQQESFYVIVCKDSLRDFSYNSIIDSIETIEKMSQNGWKLSIRKHEDPNVYDPLHLLFDVCFEKRFVK